MALSARTGSGTGFSSTAVTVAATSVVINKPTATQPGDLMVIACMLHLTGGTATLSGWSAVPGVTNPQGAANASGSVLLKIAGPSEPSSYTITTSSATSETVIQTFTGNASGSVADATDNTNGITGSSTLATFSSDSITAPSQNDFYVMCLVDTGGNAPTITALPAGGSDDVDAVNSSTSGIRAGAAIAHIPLTASGATGTFSWTSSSAITARFVFLIRASLAQRGLFVGQAINRSGTY